MGKYPTLKGIKMMKLKKEERQKNGYDCGVLIVAAGALIYQKEEAGLKSLPRQAREWRSLILVRLADRLRSAPLPDVEAAAPLKQGAHAPKRTATDEQMEDHTNDGTPRKRSRVVDDAEVEDVARENDEDFVESNEEESDGSEGEESAELEGNDNGKLRRRWGRKVTGFEDETKQDYLVRIKTLKGKEYELATEQRRSLVKKLREEADPAYAAKTKQRQRQHYLRQRVKAGYEVEEDDLVTDDEPNIVMAPCWTKKEVDKIVDVMVKDPDSEGIPGKCPFECLAGVNLDFTGGKDDPLHQHIRVAHGHLLFEKDLFICTDCKSGFPSTRAKDRHFCGLAESGKVQVACRTDSCMQLLNGEAELCVHEVYSHGILDGYDLPFLETVDEAPAPSETVACGLVDGHLMEGEATAMFLRRISNRGKKLLNEDASGSLHKVSVRRCF
ncbi:hypothetical protein LTR97_005157 [Elasticomyces elasticus]|uniref:Uncharacterized protein n=1 Tax=Elasticomyces elasticus TaxID=574655 RepID=A0AAN7W6N7_9PEZI|nr:hypothetical protein LTR97_005157 [Elasticomyces elasticus]